MSSGCCILVRKKSLVEFRAIVKILLLMPVFISGMSHAAEWKSEPGLSFNGQYNDNVRMQSDQSIPEATTGFSLVPRIKFSGQELSLWDMSVDARGRMTRYQDIEDADSDDIFFSFDGGRNTELSAWRLNASFDRNTNFDTDYETQNPDAGTLNDRTERKTATVSPSVRWSLSETSQMSFSLTTIDVSYAEKINQNVQDYDYDSAQYSAFWRIGENHQLGFTGAYSEYDSPEANFAWENTELSLDYTYSISQTSTLSLSLGGRELVSTVTDGLFVCSDAAQSLATCTLPATVITEDLVGEDRGTVTDISYTSESETASHNFSGGRTVIPSSFGGAQEQRKLSYLYRKKHTERLSSGLILDASETETLSGIDSSNDRALYRIEPSLNYRLSKNWKLKFIYRYIEQHLTDSDKDSSSNAVYLNLNIHWPKLVSTY